MEDAERIAVARGVEVGDRHVDVVVLPQVDVHVVELAVEMRVAEAHADALVVAVEVAEEGLDGGDGSRGVDLVDDDHEVRVVARKGFRTTP